MARAQDRVGMRLQLLWAFAPIERISDRDPYATPVQTSAAGSIVPLPSFALSSARLVRATNELQDPWNSWVKFAYQPQPDWNAELAVAHEVWCQFEPVLGKVRRKTLEASKALAFLAQRDWRAGIHGRDQYRIDQLAQLAKVSVDNWHRDWSRRWDALQRICDGLDRTALDSLLGKMKSPRQTHNVTTRKDAKSYSALTP